jgi:hypothetical protein
MVVDTQLHAQLIFPFGKILGGPQSQYGCGGKEKSPVPAKSSTRHVTDFAIPIHVKDECMYKLNHLLLALFQRKGGYKS